MQEPFGLKILSVSVRFVILGYHLNTFRGYLAGIYTLVYLVRAALELTDGAKNTVDTYGDIGLDVCAMSERWQA